MNVYLVQNDKVTQEFHIIPTTKIPVIMLKYLITNRFGFTDIPNLVAYPSMQEIDLETPKDVITEGIEFLFVYDDTKESAVKVIKALPEPSPPGYTDINAHISHEYFELEPNNDWIKYTENQAKIARALSGCLYDSTSDEEIIHYIGEILPLCEFDIEVNYPLLIAAIKRMRVLQKKQGRENDIMAMQEVSVDQRAFAQGHSTKNHFFSLLRWKGHPSKPVIMSVTAEIDQGDRRLTQIYIMQSPTWWMYKQCHPEHNYGVVSKVSMLLHSITSYVFAKRVESLGTMRIPQPYRYMRETFMKTAEAKHFKAKFEHIQLTIPLRENDNYLLLWKEWVETVNSHYCNACIKPTAYWESIHGKFCDRNCQKEHFEQ